jgi:hypothetical protein
VKIIKEEAKSVLQAFILLLPAIKPASNTGIKSMEV